MVTSPLVVLIMYLFRSLLFLDEKEKKHDALLKVVGLQLKNILYRAPKSPYQALYSLSYEQDL